MLGLKKLWSFGFGDEKWWESRSLDPILPRPLMRAQEFQKQECSGTARDSTSP